MQEMQETWAGSLGGEDPPEKEMAAHSSTLAWKIPWTEEGIMLVLAKYQILGSRKNIPTVCLSLISPLQMGA